MPVVHMEPGRLPEGLNSYQLYQVYNCLDSCMTAQLLPVMKKMLNEQTARTYQREMRLQSLCLDMSSKGFPVDEMAVLELLRELEREANKAKEALHLLCAAVWGPVLNPNSWQQVEAFFYDFLELPPVWKYDHKTKVSKRGTDRSSLEKLRDNYPSAMPFVNAILAYREATKLAGVFKKGLEPVSRRLRCSFSPSGTETGRLSSQTNPFGRGTNAQNLNDRVRTFLHQPTGQGAPYLGAGAPTFEELLAQWAGGEKFGTLLNENRGFVNFGALPANIVASLASRGITSPGALPSVNPNWDSPLGGKFVQSMGFGSVPSGHGPAAVVQPAAAMGGPGQGRTFPEGTAAPTPLPGYVDRSDPLGNPTRLRPFSEAARNAAGRRY